MQRIPADDRDDSNDEAHEENERVPSFLTARELQALDPTRPQADDSGKDEPLDDDDDEEKPPRGKRAVQQDKLGGKGGAERRR